MSLPSPLVAPAVPKLATRRELEATYTDLLAENRLLRDRIDTALRAASEAAHATQVYRNRIRSADNYLLTAADDTSINELRRDLRALLVGGMS